MSDDKQLPLHLQKKQLTALRKAARVLRDPGTSFPIHTSPPPAPPPPPAAPIAPNVDGSKKGVFLYNWNNQIQRRRTSSLKSNTPSSLASSRQHHQQRGSHSHSNSSMSSTSNNSKSSQGYRRKAAILLRCRETSVNAALATPSMRRALAARKFGIKSKTGGSSFRHHRKQMQQKKSSVNILSGSDEYSHFSQVSPLLRSVGRNRSCSSDGECYAFSTPALSTASFNPYAITNPSNVQSWDGVTESLDDENDLDEEGEDGIGVAARQGCGIPCYWSKRTPPKYRGASATCYSPSFSDTLRRKGGSILCGSSVKNRQACKRRDSSRRCRSDSFDIKTASSVGTGRSEDELSANYGELDLEARSRLDGRRWSASVRSHDGLEIIAANGDSKGQGTPDSIVSLSNRYRPMFFNELVGQNIVVQSLTNAISRGRISPVYLFQGPRGTGKTSTARIFATALNCLAEEETKPCGDCRHCNTYLAGESKCYLEVDATDKKTVDRIKQSWRTISKESALPTAPYKIFVIDECHLLPSKTWLAFLKFLEDQPLRVIFIFITTDLDCVPRVIVSRCQKYIFNKVKESDIVNRLRKIVAEENMDVEPDALDLIALNADGSLRDAETMLDQLSLLGRKITVSLVHELVGVVSDDTLLELLELAMSSETAETVKRARDLMDSGLDPLVLTSQLASLIMDIIAGTYHIVDTVPSDAASSEGTLTDAELGKLKLALKLLSEAEKQLRISSDRATWFTATLLQLGSASSVDPTLSTSSRRQSSKTTEEDPSTASKDANSLKPISSDRLLSHKSISSESFQKAAGQSPRHHRKFTQVADGSISGGSTDDTTLRQASVEKVDSNRLDSIYRRCIEKCHSNTLKQLLRTHGTLVYLSEKEGVLAACIAFRDAEIKSRAERFLSSIVNSFETVLRCNVEIRMILLSNSETSDHGTKPADLRDNLLLQQTGRNLDNKWKEKALGSGRIDDLCGKQRALEISQGSLNTSARKFHDISECSSIETLELADRKVKLNDSKGSKQGAPMQRIESIIREQRLETAWLQAVEKTASGSMNRTKPEKNQVLPQEGIHHSLDSFDRVNVPSQELILSQADKGGIPQMDQLSNHHSLAPSLLHDKSFTHVLSNDNTGYESGPGNKCCSGFFCWKSSNLHKQQRKVIKETPHGPHRDGRFLCLGDCCKSKRMGSRAKR